MTRTRAEPGTPPPAPATRRWARRLAAAVGLVALSALPTATAGATPPETGTTSRHAPLYVSDYGDNRVVALPARDGAPTPVPFDGLVRPTGMAADAADRLYVSDTGNNRVLVRTARDGGQSTVPTDGLSRPLGLALDPPGTSTSPTASTTGS
ncbi:hypothetical protein [Streptomyces sp. SP18ES09]|uniref:hypothetical protein n=1 Tax=Streptomyces sp. SP18ES09 TaxID=3002532 RepID=UPI002E7834C1|nr:hypothetical protein [Streptomyces sp. SP18ES09]